MCGINKIDSSGRPATNAASRYTFFRALDANLFVVESGYIFGAQKVGGNFPSAF